MDVMDGKMKTWNLNDGNENRANEVALIADYRFKNDLLWKFNLKYMDAPRANYVDFGGSTISEQRLPWVIRSPMVTYMKVWQKAAVPGCM